MSGNATFRITFNVSHPTISADEIEGVFELPTRFSQTVGGPKKTKSGKILDGMYKRTNVSFCLHESPLNFDDVSMNDFLKMQLRGYDREYIVQLVESGGSCNFLIGVFSDDNVMFELSLEAIQMLSEFKVSIQYDFHGGE
ncbi:hypothetical protein [Photobacterium sp. 1_MG-2023]|uniref:hypothetical protein n=1 Tax=Photobacterium sp. 1_MG-2023 TaxID=3062646 RepID=UPI0026E25863|nr:hypothetical protein [Photobacterium sp. 1_MG-2023]MDO6705967.1 hypothetical protein [Photobacterium sp. 1_MG-2023]